MPPLTSPRDATGSPMSDWGAPTAATGGEAATGGGATGAGAARLTEGAAGAEVLAGRDAAPLPLATPPAGPAELLGVAVTVTASSVITTGAGRVAPGSGSGSPATVAVTGATDGAAITCSGGAGVKGTTFREGSPRDEARGARAFSSLALIVSMVTITSPAIRTAAPMMNVLPSPACRIRGSRLLLCNPLPSRP